MPSWALRHLVVVFALLAGTAASATAAKMEPTAPLVAAIGTPRPLPGNDGLRHLEYDLQITDVFTVPVTLSSVEVTTTEGKTLLRLSGDALAALTEPLLGTSPAKTRLQVPASGSVAAVVVDVNVQAGQVPKQLAHRITIGHRSLRYAVDGQQIIKAETYAVDWVQLQGVAFSSGDGFRVEQYPGFGADVVSANSGSVVFVRDGMPEEKPNEAPLNFKQPIDYAGNQVVVQFAPGLWAVYAHLHTGSVGVRVGERVAVGQRLGRLGNSGNTTSPHLHFVITDNPVFVTAGSVPFVLDRYTLAGVVTPEAMQPALGGATPQPIAVSAPGRPQVRTHPLVLSVVDFPALPASALK